jgi:phage recombination protein Bet
MSTTALAAPIQWDDAQLLLTIKETVCRGATDAQFRMFIEVCKATGLNPFLKEIYFVPSVGVMAGRDGYLRKANEDPQFDGMETRVERDERNIPIKAICSVWRKDRGHAVICEAYFNEYQKQSDVWKKYPSAMIAKVAEVLALKRSFSINGVVTEDEIGNDEERGSKEAQKAYLADKGLTPYEKPKALPPATKPEVILELDNMLNKLPDTQGRVGPDKTIEMRHAAEVDEAKQILAEAQRDQDKKKGRSGAHGVIPLDKLANWKKLKDELRSFTGTDEIYVSTLRAKGYEHANEIQTKEHAQSIWNVLGVELKRQKERADNIKTLEEAATIIGARAFADLLGLHSCLTIEDALALSGDAWGQLITELTSVADGLKTKS